MPVLEAMNIVRQSLQGLAAAHDAGIVHRDVTPANVMLVGGEAAHAKLLDFGIATTTTAKGTAAGTPTINMANTAGVFVGQGISGTGIPAGSIVTVVYEGDDDSMAERYLVGHMEEKVGELDVMSPHSPMGAALLGASADAWVEYEAPTGKLRVKVIKVETA